MTPPDSIRALIALWPTQQALAQDLADLMAQPVTAQRVHKWAAAGGIPARYHQAVLDAARSRALPVSADLIVRLHAVRAAA